MIKKFTLNFEENGLPRTTSQQKGEAIRYKNGKPYIQHYKKNKVQALRTELIYRLKRYAPIRPTEAPVRLFVWVYFDVKDQALWGKYKTTRPDGDNYLKELKDAMTEVGFWIDDAQVVDERIVRTYAKEGGIVIQVEDLKQPRKVEP